MEADPAHILEYYRRAAEVANRQWRRQDTGTGTDTTTTDTTSTTSTSSTTSSTSLSVTSTSTRTSTSTSSSSSSSPTTSLSSVTSGSSTFSSMIVTTNSSGNVVTTTLIILPSNTAPPATSAKSTNTGAIVGGVVGGVALIALLALAFVLIRRKMRRDEFEANIFDPDRNVERPTSIGPGRNFDIASAGIGTGAGAAAGAGAAMAASDRASNVTPYSYAPTSTVPTTHYGSSVGGAPEMQQAQSPISSGYYSDYNYNQQYQNMPSVGVGETFPNPYGPGYHPAAYAGAGLAAGAGAAGLARGPTATSTSSGYPPTSPIYSQPSEGRMSPSASPSAGGNAALAPMVPLDPRAAKEREAFSRSNYAAANPSAPTPAPRTNPSPTPSRNSANLPNSPVVHQDAGRAPDPDENEDDGGAEIPPTYDSIPRELR